MAGSEIGARSASDLYGVAEPAGECRGGCSASCGGARSAPVPVVDAANRPSVSPRMERSGNPGTRVAGTALPYGPGPRIKSGGIGFFGIDDARRQQFSPARPKSMNPRDASAIHDARDTIVALSSAPGSRDRVIRASGPGAASCVAISRRRLRRAAPLRACATVPRRGGRTAGSCSGCRAGLGHRRGRCGIQVHGSPRS